ncbi:carbohydrate ABC transporter permease [Caldilinea sp.]|jgi:multiple sugar transport system permease protein|uniref:carbohydrate ABC transporter permease n=1 Tax=Caldilinea sp. TaxID=2293560 RepID=UPI0021DBD24D|nr:sugar ABC transporter permease [Caldilinea sp.]GIV68085.1 MAG: sugar ABC transporter permease [Caldilinea sp.]
MERKRFYTKRRLRQTIEGYLFISPWIIGFVLFTAGPIVASFVLSFFSWSLIRPPRLVWFDNYVVMFTRDPLFWQSLRVTMVYVVVAVPLQLLFALFLAILLNQKVRLIPFFRTLFYLPSQVSSVAMAVIFLWIYHPELGLVNDLLRLIGVQGPAWLISPQWALPALIGMSLWTVGGSMIILLAGLQDIPQHLYEAAALDGAGELAKFRYVTLPMLSPVIFFILVLGIIAGFQYFAQAYVMTRGGPLNATLFYALYLYLNAFNFLKMGYAAALAWILLLIIMAVTILQLRLARYWVYYEFEETRR